MSGGRRFYELPAGSEVLRSAPAALRNREPIAEVLGEWLPKQGLVLEIASGTGEHVVHFAETFPTLDWQPSDVHLDALRSIQARSELAALPNLRAPIELDAALPDWPIARAAAVLSINMVHISPWSSALGLIAGAERALDDGGPLILYGPWLKDGVQTAPSNVAFDADLRSRDADWGLRKVEDFAAAAASKQFLLEDIRPMPANNMMLLLRKQGIAR